MRGLWRTFVGPLLLFGVSLGAFEGVVVTPDGAPCVGARVQVLGGAGVAITDAAGRFRVEPDPVPPFVLLVSRPDGVALRPVPVAELPTGAFEIQVAPFASDEVAVVSGAAPDLELPPAAARTLVGRRDLDVRAPSHLVEILETVPGAGRLGDGLGAVPSLRGLASSRTLILLDGGRVSAERRAGPSATFLDPATVEEVEVVRGPGAVAYGSDAFGGVIRMRTRIPSASDPDGVHVHLGVADATGERSGGFAWTTAVGGGGLLVGASARRFDDYESPAGTVPESGGSHRSLRLGFQKAMGGASVRFLWRTDLASDVGKPAYDDDLARTRYPEERSHRLSLGLDRGPTAFLERLSLVASWDRYRLVTEKEELEEGAARHVSRARVTADDWGLRLEGERAVGRARLVVGFDGSARLHLAAVNEEATFAAEGPCCPVDFRREVAIDDARRTDLGAFASLRRGWGSVELAGGARVDVLSSTSSGGYFGDHSVRHAAASGFAGATARRGGFSAALQVARGFREPLLSDRFYRGITGRGFITGNPELDPETSLQVDTALRLERSGTAVALHAFAYRIDDLIERYREGRDYFFRNRGSAELRGAELEAGWELVAGLSCRLGLQAVRGTVRDDDSPMDGVPPLGGFVTLRQSLAGGWSWYGRLAAYARDDRPGPTERVTPGFVVVDAALSRRLPSAMEVELFLRNLLDRSYPASADARSVPAPGRTVRLSLRAVVGGASRR